MKKIFTAVSILILLAFTEFCCMQYVDNVVPAGKEIKQSPHVNAKIEKLNT